MNRYTYCGNNPIIYNDPTGNFAWVVPALCALGGAYLSGRAYNEYKDNPADWDWTDPGTYFWTAAGGVAGWLGGEAITALATTLYNSYQDHKESKKPQVPQSEPYSKVTILNTDPTPNSDDVASLSQRPNGDPLFGVGHTWLELNEYDADGNLIDTSWYGFGSKGGSPYISPYRVGGTIITTQNQGPGGRYANLLAAKYTLQGRFDSNTTKKFKDWWNNDARRLDYSFQGMDFTNKGATYCTQAALLSIDSAGMLNSTEKMMMGGYPNWSTQLPSGWQNYRSARSLADAIKNNTSSSPNGIQSYLEYLNGIY